MPITECQVCRLPLNGDPGSKFSFGADTRVICRDCARSLRDWMHSRMEVGLELKEKSR